MLIQFTGSELLVLGKTISATCVVRNELNEWRKSNQVVYTGGQTNPNGLPYQPRQFPPGKHEITRIVDCGEDSVYWPVFLDTDAVQKVKVWKLDDKGEYLSPMIRYVQGKGYGIHHARYKKGGELVPSNTTLGCINVKSPDDMEWLSEKIKEYFGLRQRVYIDIPPWKEWV